MCTETFVTTYNYDQQNNDAQGKKQPKRAQRQPPRTEQGAFYFVSPTPV
jgi:hypothetical protein